MSEGKQSATMPLVTNKRKAISEIILCPLLIGVLGVLEYWRMVDKGWAEHEIRNMMIFFGVLFALAFSGMLCQYFTKLRFAPDGIAFMLFHITLRRLPAEQIRLLGGVIYTKGSRRASHVYHRIAVCDCSLEELADIGEKKTPKLYRNSRMMRGWTEDMASKYLCKRGRSPFRDLDRSCKILWLEWDRERLELLQQMYPAARWIDLTDKKVFDEQLKQR